MSAKTKCPFKPPFKVFGRHIVANGAELDLCWIEDSTGEICVHLNEGVKKSDPEANWLYAALNAYASKKSRKRGRG